MSKQRGLVVGMVCFTVVVCAATAKAQFPTPEVTKQHKLLKKEVGVWDAEMKLWMAPDQEPMASKGVERVRMLGDFWVVSSYTADLAGQEFRGQAQMGYDPQKKKFVGTWIDTMTTSISTMEGTYDESTSEMTMFMTGVDPQTGKEVKSKSVTKHVDKDTRTFAIYMKDGDNWTKSMETTYKRRSMPSKKRAR